MTPIFLLDTNTVSDFLKRSSSRLVANLSAKPFNVLAISSITEAELRYWIANRPQQARLRILVDEFIARIPSLSWDASYARIYADLRAELKRLGRRWASWTC